MITTIITAIMGTITIMTISAAADMRTELLSRMRHRGLGLWTALWLVLCLLLAQQAGVVHRVVHGGLLNAPILAAAVHGQGDSTVRAPTASADATPDTHFHPLALKLGAHSCVLFDGATVADTHVGTVALPALRFGKPVKPAALAWRWPDLPARHPFHSRAPPAPLAFV
ncbi:hypothetical protein [Cupriavidus plantarum]